MHPIQRSATSLYRSLFRARSVYVIGPALALSLGVLMAAGSTQGCAVEPPAPVGDFGDETQDNLAFSRAPCAPFGCLPQAATASDVASTHDGDARDDDEQDAAGQAGAPSDVHGEAGSDSIDDACRQTDGCVWAGRCTWSPLAGECVVRSAVDCQESGFCRLLGRCSLGPSACRAGTDADCASSEACKLSGACFAVEGSCTKQVTSANDQNRRQTAMATTCRCAFCTPPTAGSATSTLPS